MLQNGHVVTQETFHYLLMGCLKDKDLGFRLALQVDTCLQETTKAFLENKRMSMLSLNCGCAQCCYVPPEKSMMKKRVSCFPVAQSGQKSFFSKQPRKASVQQFASTCDSVLKIRRPSMDVV